MAVVTASPAEEELSGLQLPEGSGLQQSALARPRLEIGSFYEGHKRAAYKHGVTSRAGCGSEWGPTDGSASFAAGYAARDAAPAAGAWFASLGMEFIQCPMTFP